MSKPPVKPCLEGDAALLAGPALDAEVGGGALAEVRAVTELKAARDGAPSHG